MEKRRAKGQRRNSHKLKKSISTNGGSGIGSLSKANGASPRFGAVLTDNRGDSSGRDQEESRDRQLPNSRNHQFVVQPRGHSNNNMGAGAQAEFDYGDEDEEEESDEMEDENAVVMHR